MKNMYCRRCGKPFKITTHKYFCARRNNSYKRVSKRTTCSKACADFLRGASNRGPEKPCKVQGCKYVGRLILGWCRKHYHYAHLNGGTPTIPDPVIKALPLTKCWAMWLAGVIDCEGWVGMFKCTKRNGTSFWCAVGVGNTNPILTNKLKSLTGCGRINGAQPPTPNAKYKYTWMVNKHNDVKRVLKTIRPYLLLKKRQADIILSLPPRNTQANALKKRLKAKLTVLNRKGVH